ncbi:DUF2993 domain-containing protein [Streptomyces sp. NBC_00536]|uniref:LmeA family phospholipid-binding protein n=1 Tax=Streptomyces sp. NBC_00536 TaxID=2975769 RepID=UPI002E811281|nr:DUF2993 domain-containing protein [Streptomyces sp. NBC_00536]WUC80337.1 DUF2993 domain-containing protein [Streptomyces sp. NBC_00536]
MRFLRTILIIAVVLGGILAGADRLAVGYAEDELAAKVQAGRGLAGETDVNIHGFPFLTQALDRRLEQVDVKLRGVNAAGPDGRKIRISELDARFHDVSLNSSYTGGKAARADGSAQISYADLTEASQNGVTVTYGGAPGKVKVTASVEVLGRSLTRSVVSTISLVNGTTVRVRADEVPGEGLPGVESLVRKRTDFDRNLDGGLPAGLKLSALTSDASGVHLTVDGSDVVLAGS